MDWLVVATLPTFEVREPIHSLSYTEPAMATTTAEERAEAAKMRSGEGGRSQATSAVDMARFSPVEIEVRVLRLSARVCTNTRDC